MLPRTGESPSEGTELHRAEKSSGERTELPLKGLNNIHTRITVIHKRTTATMKS